MNQVEQLQHLTLVYTYVTEFHEVNGIPGEFIGIAVYTLEGFTATEFEDTEEYREAIKEISDITVKPKTDKPEKHGWLSSWATCFR